MLADKTGVEKGHAWLVKSSFCQKARYRHALTVTPRDVHLEERQMERERQTEEGPACIDLSGLSSTLEGDLNVQNTKKVSL